VLDGLDRARVWLHSQGRAGLIPCVYVVLTAALMYLAHNVHKVAMLPEDLIAELHTYSGI
jgi:hypothetical protein